MQEISNKKSNVRVWLTFGSLFDHPRQVYYSWSDTFLDPNSCKILHLEHFWITQDRFTVPEATHFGVQNGAQFFIWTTFESSKTGLLFLKRHIFGSKMKQNSSFGPLLNPPRQVYYSWSDTFLVPKSCKILYLEPFWITQDRFTIPEATHFRIRKSK